MSLLLAQASTPVDTVDMVCTAVGQADGLCVLLLVGTAHVDVVGAGSGIAEVWGVLVDANDPGQGAFDGSAVRLVYHVEPPNRFWPKTSLKPY